MGKVIRIFFILLVFVHFSALGQERPVYSHYWLNPYFINPSLAGKADKIEIHMGHRQQWLGIAEAPVVSFLNFHMPLDQKMSVGLNAYSFKRGLLTTNNVLLGFGYRAMFGKFHGLRFGISGGLGNNSFDLDKADNPNDPALANIPLKSMHLDGQFGVTYYLKDFSLGIALTELFERKFINNESFGGIASNPFKNFTLNARYKFENEDIHIGYEPYLLYEVKNELANYFEAGVIAHFYDAFHFGGSFRQYYGPTVLTGFTFLEKFTLGYAYELALPQKVGIGGGTHEVHLALHLDKKQKETKPKAKPENKTKEVNPTAKPEKNEDKTGPGYQDNEYLDLQDDTVNILKPTYTDVKIIIKGKHPDELPLGFYVIAAVYNSEKSAKRQKKLLAKEGYKAGMGYGSETKQYYVYLHSAENVESVRQQKDKLSRTRTLRNVWLLKVE